MKYLIIGDAGSMHIYNFVRTVLLPKKYEVHILTLSVLPVRDLYRTFYKENGVEIYSVFEQGYANIKNTDRWHRILNLYRKVRLMKKVPNVDICHVQSVYKTSMWLVKLFRKKYRHLILSYWGGDIEDRTPSVVALRKSCFSFADCITVTVRQTYDQFQSLYGHEFDDILCISRFATEGLSHIKSISAKMTKKDCREYYQIPEGKICVTCGYSAYAEQHQDECLRQIERLPSLIRQKLHIIIPMQYGNGDESYIKCVKEAAQQCGCSYKILEQFVPFEKSVMLAIATDIYIHVRDTDAFSNVLKEHVYAGSMIIKGDWLIYRELDEMGAPMISVRAIDELAGVLESVLKEFTSSNQIMLFEPMYELYSTGKICEQWDEIIQDVLSRN